MIRSFSAALIAAAALAAPLAVSATETAPKAETASPAGTAASETQPVGGFDVADPNRRICKKAEVTGYRLRKTKVCATAAEWAARQQEERQALNRAQVQRGLKGE